MLTALFVSCPKMSVTKLSACGSVIYSMIVGLAPTSYVDKEPTVGISFDQLGAEIRSSPSGFMLIRTPPLPLNTFSLDCDQSLLVGEKRTNFDDYGFLPARLLDTGLANQNLAGRVKSDCFEVIGQLF